MPSSPGSKQEGNGRERPCCKRSGVSGSSGGSRPSTLHAAHCGDDPLRFGHLVADEGDAEHRDGAAAQRFERQQRVVDRAERRAGAEDDRHAPARKDIGEHLSFRERHQQTAGALDDERCVGQPAASMLRASISTPSSRPRDAARRALSSRRLPAGCAPAAGRLSRANDLAVRLLIEPRLHRFPVEAVERSRQRRRKYRLADAGIGAGDDEARSWLVLRHDRRQPGEHARNRRLIDIERDRDPQPRRAFRHGRRANCPDVEAVGLHARGDPHRPAIVADDHRQDLRAAAAPRRAFRQVPCSAKARSASQSARRFGSSTSIRSASRTAAAISGDGAVE